MRPLRLCVAFLFLLSATARAEDFGDISASAAAIYTGNTFHGYSETRVTLENHSIGKSHRVTLVFPDRAYNNGNSLSRVSRTVTLAPGEREIVSLWQPPLPANGNGQIRVEVEHADGGVIHAPNNAHINMYGRSAVQPVVFVSRNLDYEAVQHMFSAGSGAFTAAMAVGPPDAHGVGSQPNSWMPDVRRGGQTNWLELDYATPQTVDWISIHNSQSPSSAGFIELTGDSGTNIAKISMSSGRNSYSGSGWVSEFRFPTTSEPVKTVRLDFGRQPPYNIAIDAVEISGPTGTQWATAARASSDNSASASAYSPGSVRADSVESVRAESPVAEWSESWLAYTPFDVIALDAADVGAMPPAVAEAVGNYLSAGGNVLIFGETALPASWHPTQTKIFDDGVEYRVGLGGCFILPAKNPSLLSSQTISLFRERIRTAALYWQSLPEDASTANGVFPIVENLKIPVRGIVIIMLAFVIIIGPVNIIYLNRRNRRTWMLWTIPAISFATTLIIFAYSFLREGFTPDTRIAGLTVLDQTSHRATTVGAEAFYCPLTPSGGLNFDYGTEVTPLVHAGYGGSGSARDVDWTQTQHFQHGWISARVPAYFHLRKTETRRERIQIVNENGKLQIVNGLGAPIKSLWIADADMNIYQADNIAAGQKGGLILSKQSQAPEKSGAEGLLRAINFTASADSLNDSAGKFLLPNSYIAVLDGNPFIENALASSSPKRTKTSAVVFGILEAPDAK